MFKTFGLVMVFLLYPFSLCASESLTGDWQGTANTGNERTGFILHIECRGTTPHVSVSLPDIGVSKWPAKNVKLSDDKITLDLPSDSGLQGITLNFDGKTLRGEWKDNPSHKPATLHLVQSQKHADVEEYRLLIQGDAGKIGVSYTLPESVSLSDIQHQFPAVVLTHGSGPVSRDINRFTAESFAKQGIAAIFYDKRGIGETEGDFDTLTFEQLADDAISVAEHFHRQKGVKAVGFWGHSQGGWIAPLAAAQWKHAAFAIMSAGPLVSPAREAEWAYIFPVRHHTEASTAIPAVRKMVAAWHDGLRQDDFSDFRGLRDRYEDEAWFELSGVGSLRTFFLGQFYQSYQLYMDYEPEPTFRKLNKPVMAIFARDDESIDSQESISIAKRLQAEGKPVQLVEYAGYSHSMRKRAEQGKTLRFPNFPDDYFLKQAGFIKLETMKTGAD